MKSKPILIQKDKSGQPLEPIDPEKKHYTESWLQELIQNHPQVLPVDEIEPVFWPLIPIGREIPTTVGFIDNLFISASGYPVLVETKLWRNSEAKREVIAQALDYAGELSKWSLAELDAVSRKNNQKGVIALIQDAFDPDPNELPSEETITKNLRLGRFLILIVSDHIRSSLTSMLSYINRFPHLATNVGLVELLCYKMPGDNGEIMVVPSIVAKTEIIERSIVHVILEPDQAHNINVQQVKTQDDGKRTQTILTEDVFWETIKQKSPSSVGAVRQVYIHFDLNPLAFFEMRQTAIVVRTRCPDSEQAVSVLILYLDGNIECWPETIKKQLEKGGLDPKIGEDYRQELSKILRNRKTTSINSLAESVNLEELYKVVDGFMVRIAQSEPASEE